MGITLSDLILSEPLVAAYLRVTDLIQAMSVEADDVCFTATLPIFDVSSLFTLPQLALLLSS